MRKMKWLAVILAVMLTVVSGCGQKQSQSTNTNSGKDGVKIFKSIDRERKRIVSQKRLRFTGAKLCLDSTV